MPVRERECAGCGRTFWGDTRRCQSCRATEHPCVECGRAIRGNNSRLCSSCASADRECSGCGKAFRGTSARCQACRSTERECSSCGQVFRGARRLCSACRAIDRNCVTCGRLFRGITGRRCTACQVSGRECAECGRSFRGTHARCLACRLPADVRAAQARKDANARRARKIAAQIAGPVPAAAYAAVLASGLCVYCGGPATTVDHVRPLARGGYEVADNLAPACGSCNSSKSDRLLIDWRPERVAHAVACSPVVAAEYARQLAESAVSGRQMAGVS